MNKRMHGKAVVNLFGAFQIGLNDGQQIQFPSPMRQAILAVLLLSPRMRKTRKALQALLWANSSSSKAAGSLRKALFTLRQELMPLGSDVLGGDREAVWLDPERFVVPNTGPPESLLEGLDLGLKGAEGFEDWLREMRATTDKPILPVSRQPPPLAPPANQISLGLLRHLPEGAAQADMIRADRFTDLVLQFLIQTTRVAIFDLRQIGAMAFPFPVENGHGPSHWLSCTLEPSGKAIQLRLREAGTGRLLWSCESESFAEDETQAFVMGEYLSEVLRACPTSGAASDLFPLTALTGLFSLDTALINRTERQLHRMATEGDAPVPACLNAFAQIFTVHETLGTVRPTTVEDLCWTLSRVQRSDQMLPLCQSLIGYTLHMLHAENDLALDLLEEARRRAPRLALNLDHLAVLRMANGDLDGAEEALMECLKLGALSPWRYTYDVTGAMLFLAKGDTAKALYHANRALFRQPRYMGALRYAMAGLTLSGQVTDARRLLRRIHTLRPEFNLSDWVEGLARRSSADLSTKLVKGFQANALL